MDIGFKNIQLVIYTAFERIEAINQDSLLDAFEVAEDCVERDCQEINNYFDSLFL